MRVSGNTTAASMSSRHVGYHSVMLSRSSSLACIGHPPTMFNISPNGNANLWAFRYSRSLSFIELFPLSFPQSFPAKGSEVPPNVGEHPGSLTTSTSSLGSQVANGIPGTPSQSQMMSFLASEGTSPPKKSIPIIRIGVRHDQQIWVNIRSNTCALRHVEPEGPAVSA